MAEGARLESVFTRKGNVGSNPTLSASFSSNFGSDVGLAIRFSAYKLNPSRTGSV